MYRIAVLDDDQNWCNAIKRFFRSEFEVSTFALIGPFLREIEQYDLVIVDFSIPPYRDENNYDGCGIIRDLRITLTNPPLLVLATGFISKRDLEGDGKKFCPEADAFLSKDAGLDEILQQVKQLLTSRKNLLA